MARIEIEWLTDSYQCDDCGFSMADGADVRIDGELVIEMKPIAHCYDGDTYEKDDVYRRILQHYGRWTTVTDEAELRQQIVQLGHEVSEA